MLSNDEARVRLAPITSPAQLERLKIASAWDGHANMLYPTHLVTKRDEVIGCTSIGACLMAHSWLHTEKCRGLDARRAFQDVETVARALGYKGVAIVSPVDGSPLLRHLPDMGWTDAGSVRLWVKTLTKG